MIRGEELYSGKAKSVFASDREDAYILKFRNDTSAFDGEKVEQLDRKGMVNNKFNAFIMKHLESQGIATHFLELLSDTEALVRKLDMFPVECVVRNVASGSICRRLGLDDGVDLSPPTFEFFLKNDALHDPMINEYHIRSFGWADDEAIEVMKTQTFLVNDVLQTLFADAGMILVDFKLEFGRQGDNVFLGDEFTPDGCRIWDATSREKLDKDRFRKGLGGVVEAYEQVAQRLGLDL
ncbi:phosphoribosylaminoimidazolesuccinocarboxamide synthase [Arenicella sp. 4NH20-0111]|uniref:phosphoribosylaminoimidazolesuccinocarboxamide synthase n=1 Tax=Arenicella sp. 4NH20-0111 TaxID=3127648 RepID=UPI00310A5484